MKIDKFLCSSDKKEFVRLKKRLDCKVSSSVPKQSKMIPISSLRLPQRQQLPAILGAPKDVGSVTAVVTTPLEQVTSELQKLSDQYAPSTASEGLRVEFFRACRTVLKNGMNCVIKELQETNEDLCKLLSLVWGSHLEAFNNLSASYDVNITDMKGRIEELEEGLRSERYNYLYTLRYLEETMWSEDNMVDELKRGVSEVQGEHSARLGRLKSEIGRLESERNTTSRMLRRLTEESIASPKVRSCCSEKEEMTRELAQSATALSSCRAVIMKARTLLDDKDDPRRTPSSCSYLQSAS
eukprot:TRINITY_DN5491_c0_g1_i5.p1 TRINITY_DN5491_c0_g1~~TRINITY_DN5491_c0_g1_i5.p1  ORF type:complete len:320 (+),score=43.56 TRINITY_DN5491_c0_g1_i5:70-960(+)